MVYLLALIPAFTQGIGSTDTNVLCKFGVIFLLFFPPLGVAEDLRSGAGFEVCLDSVSPRL